MLSFLLIQMHWVVSVSLVRRSSRQYTINCWKTLRFPPSCNRSLLCLFCRNQGFLKLLRSLLREFHRSLAKFHRIYRETVEWRVPLVKILVTKAGGIWILSILEQIRHNLAVPLKPILMGPIICWSRLPRWIGMMLLLSCWTLRGRWSWTSRHVLTTSTSGPDSTVCTLP